MKQAICTIGIISIISLMAFGTSYAANEAWINKYENGEYEENNMSFMGFTEAYIEPYNKGNMYFRQKNYEAAMREYEIALEKEPSKYDECKIRINMALSLVTPIDKNQVTKDNLKQTIATLDEAIAVLCEDGCADNEGKGHSEDAQRLKEDIEKFKKELENEYDNNSSSKDNQEEESSGDDSGESGNQDETTQNNETKNNDSPENETKNNDSTEDETKNNDSTEDETKNNDSTEDETKDSDSTEDETKDNDSTENTTQNSESTEETSKSEDETTGKEESGDDDDVSTENETTKQEMETKPQENEKETETKDPIRQQIEDLQKQSNEERKWNMDSYENFGNYQWYSGKVW